MRKLLVGTALATLLLSGCASMEGSPGYCALCGDSEQPVNDYARFYTPSPDAQDIVSNRIAPPTGSPRVDHVAHFEQSVAFGYERQGYALIGSSSFVSGLPESEQGAIAQGISVGADLVLLLDPTYKGSMSTSIPITTPSATTSYTNGTGTLYGAGATTTTYGSDTTYMPITVNRSGYEAAYLVKRRNPFGVYLRDLTDSERQLLQTNRGAYILVVVDNSPAYNSDILPGDVIMSINGQSPSGVAGAFQLINANQGRTVDVTIARAGKTLSKRVSIQAAAATQAESERAIEADRQPIAAAQRQEQGEKCKSLESPEARRECFLGGESK